MEFKYSPYQEDVFDFVQHGYGNAVVSAVAGSGKTKTIIKAIDFIKPDKRILFLAFNSSIVENLKTKITREKTDIKTLHSLGLSILKYNFKEKNIEIFEDKYKRKLFNMLEEIGLDSSLSKNYTKNILKLCNLGRFSLIKTKMDLLKISNKYSIVLDSNELDMALELIEWGGISLNESNKIDYTDMIYLPNVLNVKTFKYDFIIIDEAQDLSISQMSLFMKCFRQGGRFIAVGDERQAIYGFSGADSESFNKLRNISNTIELPLSICYRCPKNVIKYVQKLVPEIEFNKNSLDGYINFNAKTNDLIDGDMVICRNTAPLVKLYTQLIINNITCYIKGIDIGINLLDILECTSGENISTISNQLTELLITYIKKNEYETGLSESEIKLSQEYNDFVDKVDCLKILSYGLKTKQDLIDKVINIFSDENKKGICLSTIHKAKGLEADNVYVLNRGLMPSKFVKLGWEITQEQNLEYVAFTRSKKILGFINND